MQLAETFYLVVFVFLSQGLLDNSRLEKLE
jgi:hypothetical protein